MGRTGRSPGYRNEANSTGSSDGSVPGCVAIVPVIILAMIASFMCLALTGGFSAW